MRPGRALTLISVAGVCGLASWCCSELWQRASRLAIDAELGGWALPQASKLEPFVHWVAQATAMKAVYLDTAGEPLSVRLCDLGIALDIDGTLERARGVGELPSRWQRIRRVFTGPPRAPRVVEPVFEFDALQARRTLQRVASLVNRDPIDARLDYAHHRRVDDQPGRELDVEATLDEIRGKFPEESDIVELRFRAIPARVGAPELPAVDVTRVLSQYETSFAHRAGARAVNIRRGAQLLDGFILAPHATFSFNHVVGSRSESRGFVNAPVIVNDEIDKGVGGGICQVASTLHAAAVYAGLPMIERRSHSRASGYAPLGLDATVIEGKVDLRFSNPYDEPLLFHVFLPTASTLRVEILGREPRWQIEHDALVVKRYPFLRRVVDKPELAAGEFKRSQKGTYGWDILSVVRYTDASGATSTHQYKSTYYPVPEVFWVGSATPLGSLPPLPEGAEGIEDREESAQ